MPYFTSWDINVFLCLLEWGLPEDVVKGLTKMTKKVHEEFSLREARTYWNINSPRLVRFENGETLISLRFHISELLDYTQTRINVFNRRHKTKVEFKIHWRLRSIEDRQKKVIEWCKFGDDYEKDRHQKRLRYILHKPFVRSKAIAEAESKMIKEREEYNKNLWSSWEAWGYNVNTPEYMNDATYAERYPWDRRECVSQWYEGIHPGRFFLFYKENKIIQERNRRLQKGSCEDGYQYPKTPIYDWGPYEQLIEDLRCIDGPGLGESPGSKVEHIDDLFP